MPLTPETRFRWVGQPPQFRKQADTLRSRATCPKGHLYDAQNTRVDSTGRRHCRACDRERGRRRRADAREPS